MPPNPFQEGLSVEVSGDSSGLDSALDSAESGLTDFKAAVGVAGAALTALATGALAKATKAAADFEDSMADVQKVTSEETADELHDQIMDLAEDIPIAQSELATLAEQAGKFGAETPEEIMKFVETVGKIQTATDMAAEEAGTRFAKIAGAVGLPLSEVDKLANGTNALADSMKTDADEITDTATRASNTLAQQLGLGEDAVLALSASMNEVSPSAELAGSSLRRVGEVMMNPKKIGDIADALGMTEEEFRQMRDENPHGLIKQIAETMNENGSAAEQLRGDIGKAATDFSKLGTQLDRTEEAQQTVNQQFEEGTSLQKEMDIRTETASGQWQIFKNKLQNAAITIGEQVLPHALDLLDFLTKAVDAFSALNEKTDGIFGVLTLLAGVISGIAVSVGVLINALGGMTAIMGFLSAAAGGVTTAIGVLSTALTLLTGPIGLIVAAIAGLALAWKTNLFGIRDKAKVVINFLRGLFDRLVSDLKTAVSIIKDALLTGDFNEAWTRAKQLVMNAINDISSWLKTEAKPAVVGALKTLASGARGVFKSLVKRLIGEGGIIPGFIADVKEFISGIGKDDVKEAFTILGRGIRLVFLSWFNLHKKLGKIVKNFLEDVVDYLKTDAKGDLKTAGKVLFGAFEAAIKTIVDAHTPPDGLVVRLMDSIVSYLKNDAKGDLKRAAEALWGVIKAAAEGLYQGLIGGSLIPDMFDDIVSYIKNDAASDLASAGKDAARALANGIKNKFNAIMPDEISVPKVTIGGGGIDIPSTTVAGETIGGGSLDIPSTTVGGQSIDVPALDSGGMIEKAGLAMLHAGEAVIPSADVDRSGTRGPMSVKIDVDARGATDPQAVGTAVADEFRALFPQ